MRTKNIIKNDHGKFAPIYKIWSLENFYEGYVSSRSGRFKVKIPGHHRADKNGWMFRSIAAYEAYHLGVIVTREYVVHHKDGNTLNDSKENLHLVKFGDHNRLHHNGKKRPYPDDLRIGGFIKCDNCESDVYKPPSNINKRNFCSSKCCNEYRKKAQIKKVCLWCGSIFYISKSRGSAKFCSIKCVDSLKRIFKNGRKN